MSWNYVVLHHSAGHDNPGLDADDVRDFHVRGRGWRDVGYHWLVERVNDDFIAVQGRSSTWPGAHEPQANRNGIGICFVGNFSAGAMPPGAVEAGARLVASLLHLMAITTADHGTVRLHRDFKPTECPGKLFPADELRARAQELLDTAEV